MKILSIIMALLFVSGCSQLTGPAKAEHKVEQCVQFFRWDEELKTNIVTHERCTTSSSNSNRVYEDGILIESNASDGSFKVDTKSIKNADESSIVQAFSVLIAEFATPGVVNAFLKALQEKQNE
jgi:hypothetical protein